MTTFVIVAVLFILIGFVLGFFLTSRAANKNQGQMKHCQSCQFFRSYQPFSSATAESFDDHNGYPLHSLYPDWPGMADEQSKSCCEQHKEGK